MKKILIVIFILFLPIIIAGLWFLSVSRDSITTSNVSAVSLVFPDGSNSEYISDEDKSFFVELKDSIVSIEKQDYDPDVYSLYKLEFERPNGDINYYLCLSADVKNCLAYDSKGNWYRIDKEYARRFLAKYDTSSVYRNSDVPVMKFNAGGVITEFMPTYAEWKYLLSDESYERVLVDDTVSAEVKAFVTAGVGFDFTFDVNPDWYDVKIYEGETLVYDALINNVTEFSQATETVLRAVITAEWYEDTTNLYHGNAVYEFYFDYDIKADYSINSDVVSCGDFAVISISNANNENMTVTTTIPGVEELSSYLYENVKIVPVPIPSDTADGEYRVNVHTEKTDISIPVNVKAKNFDSVEVSFVSGESAEEYRSASDSFPDEISSAFEIGLSECQWNDGLITPVKKFIDGVEQYWISSPSYGVAQRVDGIDIGSSSFGIHYVKSVAADNLEIRAVANGKIAFAGITKLYGNTVIIEHGFGFKSVYGHVDSLNFAVGDEIEAGTVIGFAKPSGFSIANTEAFFGICVNEVFLNPYNFIVEPRNPDSAEISQPIEFLNNIE